jgi:hypothetical protein
VIVEEEVVVKKAPPPRKVAEKKAEAPAAEKPIKRDPKPKAEKLAKPGSGDPSDFVNRALAYLEMLKEQHGEARDIKLDEGLCDETDHTTELLEQSLKDIIKAIKTKDGQCRCKELLAENERLKAKITELEISLQELADKLRDAQQALRDAGLGDIADQIFKDVGLAAILGEKCSLNVFDRLYQDALRRLRKNADQQKNSTHNNHSQALLATLQHIYTPQQRQLVNYESPDTAGSSPRTEEIQCPHCGKSFHHAFGRPKFTPPSGFDRHFPAQFPEPPMRIVSASSPRMAEMRHEFVQPTRQRQDLDLDQVVPLCGRAFSPPRSPNQLPTPYGLAEPATSPLMSQLPTQQNVSMRGVGIADHASPMQSMMPMQVTSLGPPATPNPMLSPVVRPNPAQSPSPSPSASLGPPGPSPNFAPMLAKGQGLPGIPGIQSSSPPPSRLDREREREQIRRVQEDPPKVAGLSVFPEAALRELEANRPPSNARGMGGSAMYMDFPRQPDDARKVPGGGSLPHGEQQDVLLKHIELNPWHQSTPLNPIASSVGLRSVVSAASLPRTPAPKSAAPERAPGSMIIGSASVGTLPPLEGSGIPMPHERQVIARPPTTAPSPPSAAAAFLPSSTAEGKFLTIVSSPPGRTSSPPDLTVGGISASASSPTVGSKLNPLEPMRLLQPEAQYAPVKRDRWAGDESQRMQRRESLLQARAQGGPKLLAKGEVMQDKSKSSPKKS